MALLLMFFLDFGTPDSAVVPEWTQVTPATVATAAAPGWVEPGELKAQDRMWPRTVENKSAGRDDPPPVYTNDLTRDAVTGTAPAQFRLPLPAGEYELWACAGSSERDAYTVFDFTLGVGDQQAWFQMDGGYWFETRRLRFETDGNPVIDLTPKSKWVLSGLAVYPVADAANVAARLEAFEQSIYALPADLMADWQYEEPNSLVDQMPRPSRMDLQRGYLVHHRHYLENVYPTTVPYPTELNPTLRAFATQGEDEPLTFSVYALQPLSGATVTVSDLQGPGLIPAARIDVKTVQYARSRPNYRITGRYRIVPDYLRPFDSVEIPAEENQRFWLTVQAPPDAAPGVYRGEATFTPAGRPSAAIPIEFRVLDIQLQKDPAKTYGMYYRDPLDKAQRATDDFSRDFYLRQARLQAEDMNAHGTVLNVPLTAWVSVPRDPATPLDFKLDWTPVIEKIEHYIAHGYAGPYVCSINDEGLFQRHLNGESYGSHIRGAKEVPDPFSAELTAMIEFIEAGRKEQGLPEFLYYPVDEPGHGPGEVAYMTQVMRAIQAGGGKTYVTADPTSDSFAPMAPYVNVWSTQPFLPEREVVLADMAARDVEYWCYPNHINGENDHTTVAGARMTYGFGFWRSGFVTLNPWIYSSSSGHPFNNLDGSAADFFNRPGPDGTVWPVPMWEAYREGYDDYRYVYTLQQEIAAARVAGKSAEADAAQAVLDKVWDAIEVKAKYKEDSDVWGYRTFDAYRWLIAEQILKLREAVG